MNEKDFWNEAAGHYQQAMFFGEEGDYKDRLLKFLEGYGLLAGESILDIGCGTGKYAIEFVKRGCCVTALDFSEKMLKFAQTNLGSCEKDWKIIFADWVNTTPKELGLKKKYELVFASMTPAVQTVADMKKMNEVSLGYCFISQFTRRENLMLRHFCEIFGLKDQVIENRHEDARIPQTLIAALKKDGYMPTVRCEQYDWADKVLPDEAAAKFKKEILDKMDAPPPISERDIIRAALSISDNEGTVYDRTAAEAAWILWDVNERGK